MEPQKSCPRDSARSSPVPAGARGPRPCRPSSLRGGARGSARARYGERRGRVHFPRVESHDRFRGGHEPAGEGRRRPGARWRAPLSARPVTAPAGSRRPPSGPRNHRAQVPAVRTWPARPRLGYPPVSAPSPAGSAARVDRGASCVGQWRRRRHSTRPVLKHGPRSLACARVNGSYETLGRSESEGRLGLAQVGSAVWTNTPFGGAPPARPVCVVSGAEHERVRRDPKDGELCLSRPKPEETLVEVRSDSDVQIDRQTWV